MMKKYFTDGLIQIAIVLSLMRTDLNRNNLNNYVSNYPEIHEIILGSSSAYTQTQHSQSWLNDGTNGFAHHKSIDNYYSNSIFSELHSLSRYRRVRQRDNDINAWLVVGEAHPSVSGNGETAQQGSASHNSVEPVPQPSVPPPPTDNHSQLGRDKPGSELTKEDMALIDILWRQDMDLGVGREVFDQNLRREMEKERELEELKEQAKDKEQNASQDGAKDVEQDEPSANFIVDGETGELIPVPVNVPDIPPAVNMQQTQAEPSVFEQHEQLFEQQAYVQQEIQPLQGINQQIQPQQCIPQQIQAQQGIQQQIQPQQGIQQQIQLQQCIPQQIQAQQGIQQQIQPQQGIQQQIQPQQGIQQQIQPQPSIQQHIQPQQGIQQELQPQQGIQQQIQPQQGIQQELQPQQGMHQQIQAQQGIQQQIQPQQGTQQQQIQPQQGTQQQQIQPQQGIQQHTQPQQGTQQQQQQHIPPQQSLQQLDQLPQRAVAENPQPQNADESRDLQEEIEAIIAAATEHFTDEQQQPGGSNTVSMEQQWAEVADLLTSEHLTLDNTNALLQNATLSAAINPTPGGFNQTIAELNNSVPDRFAMMPPIAITNDTFEPFPGSGVTNDSIHDSTYGSLFNFDSQALMFSNMSGGGSVLSDVDRNSTLNHTEHLLQELMDADLSDIQFSTPADTTNLMHALQAQLNSNVSSDSAVSSMSSPSHLQDMNETGSVFSNQTSMYDSLQGATGGSDYDSAGETSKVSKQMQFNHHYNTDLQYHMPENMNHSGAFNDSDHHYTPANLNQVNHNHTYPLQPAPEPQVQVQRRVPRASKVSGVGNSKVSRSKAKRSLTPDYDPRIASARDARKARQLKVPFSMDCIIHSSVDEFNEMLNKHDLSEPQLQLIRDIRRRGKNKVAAQNCRKRKLDVILTLEQEVMSMRQQKEDLLRERHNVVRQRSELKTKLDVMYREVLSGLHDSDGQPYDPSKYSLQHEEDGSIIVVPQNTTCPPHDRKPKTSKKKKNNKKN